MTLAAGTRLGTYEVLSPLGAGGMGEVWRATDTKLGRDVALKVLPEEFARDPERMARFEREAKVLASLNHPNIAHLYGLETVASGTDANGDADADADADAGTGADENSKLKTQNSKLTAPAVTFLVMELVEGEDLSERISRGPIPIDEAIPIALQIAEALEAAHESGIVHRDLKPANIKLTEDGGVKVLDFGLAKAWETESSDSSLSLSPTMTQHATAAGVILGTAAYMSPEQARGKKVDRRADIWAFGVVLWEMLTGHKLFEGETVSDVMAAVLTCDPDMSELPADTPGFVRHVIDRCLRRDPRNRMRDIGEVRLELEEPADLPPDSVERVAAVRRSGWRTVAWTMMGLSLGLAVILGLLWLRGQQSDPAGPIALSVALPPELSFTSRTSRPVVSVSPDGAEMVVVAHDGISNRLYRRSMGSPVLEVLDGTEGANAPFHSPDGRWIGFTSGRDGTLRKLSLDGGQLVTLADANWGGGSWGADDSIVYTPEYTDGLWMVPAAGGEPIELTRPDPEVGELNHSWPDHVPGTDAVLFTSFRLPLVESRIEVLDLATRERRVLIENAVFARFVAPTFVVFVRDHTLLAARFDPNALELAGPPVPVFGDAFVAAFEGNSQFDVSENGTLAWIPASLLQPPTEVVSVDRRGRVDVILEADRRYGAPALSPDGKRLALMIDDDNPDVWVYDLERRILNRITSSPRSELSPIWYPDGRRLAVMVDDPPFNIYSVPADGSDELDAVFQSPYDSVALAISRDGAKMVIRHSQPDRGTDVELISLDGAFKPRAIRATRFVETAASLSPDGTHVAYHANDTGSFEIYVQPLVGEAGRVQVSRSGGDHPRWGQNGELFFWRDDELVVVPIETEPRLEIGEPEVLFTFDRHTSNVSHEYSVSSDGEFIVATRIPEASKPREIRVVLNWVAELERLTGEGSAR